MKAFLKNYRQSPRKVRLVANLIKGKKVDEALVQLNFLAKRAGDPIQKLLLSAVANAKNMGIDKENLFIKEIRVDKGLVMKRMMPAAMGRGHRINKRTSHVNILLAEKNTEKKEKKEKTKNSKKEVKKVIKKEEVKKEIKKIEKVEKITVKQPIKTKL
ncbi:MAG: 50S ribosomal protein L22 [Patescibacteria group bacterium]